MPFTQFALIFAVLFASSANASDKNVNYAEFEKYVERLMKEFHVPGLAVGVVSKSGPLYMKGFGVRGVESNLPVTPDTQFAIGSTTKAFTATSVGILVDQKMIEWDKAIKSHYLPDFEMLDPVATNIVTSRDLLTHRTGLPRHDLVWYGSPFNRQDIYERIKYLTPTASIREKVQYQNIMFMVAGYLVGKRANTSWEVFTAKNILEKLQMTNSNFSVQEMQKSADFSMPHAMGEGKIVQIPFRSLDSVGPAGSMNSSIIDMGKWLRLQLNGGELDGVRVISAANLSEIHKPQMVSSILGFDKVFEEFGEETYGMGWFSNSYLNKKMIHHGGGIDGFITFVAFLPELDIGIVVFGNSGTLVPYFAAFGYLDLLIKGSIGPWEERMKKIYEPKKPKLADSSPAPLSLDQYTGVFTHPAYGSIKVSRSAEPDQIDFSHFFIKYKLAHFQNHSFLPVRSDKKLDGLSEPVSFKVDWKGDISSFFFKIEEDADPIEFQRQLVEERADFMPLDLAPNLELVPQRSLRALELF